jgi:hypothetical protein
VCEVDGDCKLFSASCCGHCPGSVAREVFNRKAHQRRTAEVDAACEPDECPDVSCARAPPCYDVPEAYCDAGTCAIRIHQDGRCDPDAPPLKYAEGDRAAVAKWYEHHRHRPLPDDACLAYSRTFPGVVAIGAPSGDRCEAAGVLVEDVVFDTARQAAHMGLGAAGWVDADRSRRETLARAWIDEVLGAYRVVVLTTEPPDFAATTGQAFEPPQPRTEPDGGIAFQMWVRVPRIETVAAYQRDTYAFDRGGSMRIDWGELRLAPIE